MKKLTRYRVPKFVQTKNGNNVRIKKHEKSQIMLENYQMFSNSYVSSNSYGFLKFLS